MLEGGWSLAELQAVSLPEDVAKAFTAVTEGMKNGRECIHEQLQHCWG